MLVLRNGEEMQHEVKILEHLGRVSVVSPFVARARCGLGCSLRSSVLAECLLVARTRCRRLKDLHLQLPTPSKDANINANNNTNTDGIGVVAHGKMRIRVYTNTNTHP